jgi:hypothetical protein
VSGESLTSGQVSLILGALTPEALMTLSSPYSPLPCLRQTLHIGIRIGIDVGTCADMVVNPYIDIDIDIDIGIGGVSICSVR